MAYPARRIDRNQLGTGMMTLTTCARFTANSVFRSVPLRLH